MHKKIEIIFNSLYLLTVSIFSFYYIFNQHENKTVLLWGIMSLVLLLGDSCHLFPRIMNALSKKEGIYKEAMDKGKLAAGITMTIFYLLLWHCGLIIFNISAVYVTILLYILAIMRIVFILLPNKNISPLFRNIPFIVIGAFVLWLYALNGNVVNGFNYMWIAIFLSFMFYIPVVLLSRKIPAIGALMLPKSCAYIWIICMGLSI